MSEKKELMSDAFQVFMREAPQHAQAWMTAVRILDAASALDKKTERLAYLAALAAQAKEAGASREEVISALLLGLPAAGTIVTRSLPAALRAYDSAGGGG